MRHVLITGASGFIGRVLCKHFFKRGITVRALLRREVMGSWDEAVLCDLGSEALPPRALKGIDTVFHLAGVAHSWGLPDEVYYRINVEGTRTLVERAAEAGVKRFVYFSSVKAMAEPPENECVDESWSELPKDAYGLSKRETEQVVLDVARQAGMHAVALRPALVYGPGVKGNLRRMMRMISSGWCPPLPDTGNRRSVVHVDDLCALAIDVAQKKQAAGKCYIAADTSPVSTRALYEGLLRAFGRDVPRWSIPSQFLRASGHAGDWASILLRKRLSVNSDVISRLLDSSCYNSEKAIKELGWQPRNDLISSLPEMVKDFRGDG